MAHLSLPRLDGGRSLSARCATSSRAARHAQLRCTPGRMHMRATRIGLVSAALVIAARAADRRRQRTPRHDAATPGDSECRAGRPANGRCAEAIGSDSDRHRRRLRETHRSPARAGRLDAQQARGQADQHGRVDVPRQIRVHKGRELDSAGDHRLLVQPDVPGADVDDADVDLFRTVKRAATRRPRPSAARPASRNGRTSPRKARSPWSSAIASSSRPRAAMLRTSTRFDPWCRLSILGKLAALK